MVLMRIPKREHGSATAKTIAFDSNQILLNNKDQQVLIVVCAPGRSLLSAISLVCLK